MAAGPDLFDDRGDDLAGRLSAWAATARADDAAAARAREGFLRRTAGEDATFAGVLVDLAERGGTLLLVTTTGRRHVGELRAVGSDFVLVRVAGAGGAGGGGTGNGGRDVLVRLAAIVSVQAGPAAISAGDRPVAVPAGLVEALALLAEDRPRVLVVTDGGDAVAGALRSMGRDVLTVTLEGDGRVAYVPAAVVTEVAVA